MIFIDSSVWISAFRDSRSPEARALTGLLDQDEVAISIPVYLELLTGAKREDRSRLRSALSALPMFYPSHETWARMEEWTMNAMDRRERFGIMDLLVASIARDQEGSLWSLDADFGRMARLGLISLFRPG